MAEKRNKKKNRPLSPFSPTPKTHRTGEIFFNTLFLINEFSIFKIPLNTLKMDEKLDGVKVR